MVASYDDATQARLHIEVTEHTQTEVKLSVKTTLLHNELSEFEELEAEEVILTVDEAELDLGGARGISLFDESGTAPRIGRITLPTTPAKDGTRSSSSEPSAIKLDPSKRSLPYTAVKHSSCTKP